MTNPIHIEQWAGNRRHVQTFYMAVLDNTGRMTFVNAQMFRTSRHAKAAAGRTEFTGLIYPCDRDRITKTIAECRERQTAANVSARVMNSPYQWIRWQISPFPGSEDGRLLCLGEDVYGEALQAMPQDPET